MPNLILTTIKAGFDFGTELLKYLQTDQGKAFIKKMTEDAAAREKWWAEVCDWSTKFFKGDLLKGNLLK